jgi:competence protein ComEC
MRGVRTRVGPAKLIVAIIEAQRGTLLLWMPVAMSFGIGGYFGLTWEPDFQAYLTLIASGFVVAVFLRVISHRTTSLTAFIMLIPIGFILSGISANMKAAPVLGFHFYGAVQGRIVAIDRSSSDRPRITLDQLVLQKVSAAKTPALVRISLHYKTPFVLPEPGQQIIINASLSPPEGPVEPGGFNFQRFAWFLRLGAVGYSRTPLVEFAPPDRSGWKMTVFSTRIRLANALKARLSGQKGAFAAAILVGDRSGVDPVVLQSLRASNLAHLLAISGLHMGLLTGFVFAAIRYGLALVPRLALRLHGKKIAAVFAFVAAISYLILSGGNIATQRAFVMVSVMLLAVLLDRRAITLRAVAMAAVIVLVLRPESLIEAGFQMSFAATTALVAAFAALSGAEFLRPRLGKLSGLIRGTVTLILSSAVAGAATAPISAYHFNQIAQFGLIANLASVPVMGFVIMPAAVIGILLAPFGLDSLAWMTVGAGIDWILVVANWVGSLEYAVHRISKPDSFVLPVIAGGFLLVVLLRGPIRTIGILPLVIGFSAWVTTTRPAILLSPNGRVLGLQTEAGRVINRDRGNGFIVRNWLENDGDAATQEDAALRTGLVENDKITQVILGHQRISYQWGKDLTVKDISDLCRGSAIVIAPQYLGESPQDCFLIDSRKLHELGASSIENDQNKLVLTGARQINGTRLWTR